MCEVVGGWRVCLLMYCFVLFGEEGFGFFLLVGGMMNGVGKTFKEQSG